MGRTLLLIVLASIGTIVSVPTMTTSTACDQPTKHYTTMGCIASEHRNDRGCPLSYDCHSLEDRQNDKCYLFGKVYSIGEQVPGEETASTCTALHTCVDDGQDRAYFIYAYMDCIEMIQPPNENCILQYQPNVCCSTSKICGQDIAQLATCNIDGKFYHEGQRMRTPSNPCRHCICSVDFEASDTDCNENCYEEKCTFEIHWTDSLAKGAAPVYLDGFCCPSSWRLPEETDKLVKGPNSSKDTSLECKYGNITLKVGDSVNDKDDVNRCTCTIPPMVHCS
ncbi:uncharacterized protein LOC135708048 [Ochlerotatus camptorhynchus]|uniref:uncharacterized protein LOC135708048 n=1 Tax=Ochlerotatus camptorhynchus TaxID=644619 RepID=UPI0031E09EC3